MFSKMTALPKGMQEFFLTRVFISTEISPLFAQHVGALVEVKSAKLNEEFASLTLPCPPVSRHHLAEVEYPEIPLEELKGGKNGN